MKKLLSFITIALFLTGCFEQKKVTIGPFVRSVISNTNVYKTKDSLDLYTVYNRVTKTVVNDTAIIYRINPFTKMTDKAANMKMVDNYIRYNLVADSGNIIRILKGTYVNGSIKTKDTSKHFIDSIRYVVYDSNYSPKTFPDSFYFKIKNSTITPAQSYLATQHITGLPLTIPIKYRYQTGSKANVSPFSLSVGINYAFGYKFRVNDNPYISNYVRTLLFTGFASDNYIPKDSITSLTYKPITNVVWSYGGGITFEAGNRFNFGIMYGADRMFGNKKDWYYENKAWFGFGIGYKFQ